MDDESSEPALATAFGRHAAPGRGSAAMRRPGRLERLALAPTYEVVGEDDGWAVIEHGGTASPGRRIIRATFGLDREAAVQVVVLLRRAVRAGWRAGLARAVLALEEGPSAGL